ncbi:MAG: hypothetical protein KKF80_03270 [Candidatus Omnitrophica bacterium]|nr:hypothetical protein [Candidatus Omnitrophota bacterium]
MNLVAEKVPAVNACSITANTESCLPVSLQAKKKKHIIGPLNIMYGDEHDEKNI